jgi:hypothetical protein
VPPDPPLDCVYEMKASKIQLGLLAAIATFALPSPALAAYFVPPGNSAATQYTEAYPTAGGNREAGGAGKDRSPSEVLGSRNAAKLQSQGPDGRAAAALAAETAPGGVASNRGAANRGGAGSEPNGAGSQPGSGPGVADGEGIGTDRSNGSSGIGEVIGQASGSPSSGGLGLLLPLALLATAAWALAFLWRQRRRPTP